MTNSKFSLGILHRMFNNEVRKRRLEKGMKQSQLAQMCNVSGALISNIETFRTYPDIDISQKIANILQADIKVLFPQWIELLTDRKTSLITEHQVTERILDHPELKALPAEINGIDEIEKNFDRDLMSKQLNSALNTLRDRERRVLEERYGLVDDKSKTLKEISGMFGITTERIRQIELKGLRKLRHPQRRAYFNGFIPSNRVI